MAGEGTAVAEAGMAVAAKSPIERRNRKHRWKDRRGAVFQDGKCWQVRQASRLQIHQLSFCFKMGKSMVRGLGDSNAWWQEAE